MAPTLVASRTALPPEGAVLAWGGPARRTVVLQPVAWRSALPPGGALRLRSGKAGSAALAGEHGDVSLVASDVALDGDKIG